MHGVGASVECVQRETPSLLVRATVVVGLVGSAPSRAPADRLLGKDGHLGAYDQLQKAAIRRSKSSLTIASMWSARWVAAPWTVWLSAV